MTREPLVNFDALCYLGRRGRMHEGEPETAQDLLAALDHFGIHEALVVDPLASEANPTAGNARILAHTREHPRLHPAWVGLMPQSRELPPPRELVARMRDERVGALFLYYRRFDVRLDDWGVDELLAALQAARVPLFLCPDPQGDGWPADRTDWAGVVALCRRFPELPVVVTKSRIYPGQRAAWAALAACPNLRLDAAGLWLHHAIEFACREFGSHRLVWSSRLPARNPGGMLMQIHYSELGPEELRAIAGGNLRQLLSWNENIRFVGEEVSFPEADDALHRAARERRPFSGERFLDCHGHIGGASTSHVVHATPADLVREMDRFGIARCLVFGLEGVSSDETYSNDVVAATVRQFPDRFIGFTLVNPNHGERLLHQELERGLALGMRGVKLICDYQGYPTEGPLVDVACEFAHEHGQFILNHNWGLAAQLSRLCLTYPRACFITGHSSTAYGEVAREAPNLFICTCPCIDWGMAERLVEIYGADRILFGSDLTDLPIGWGLGQIVYARLAESDKRKILGGNLARLLRRSG